MSLCGQGLEKSILVGNLEGRLTMGRSSPRWENITELTGLLVASDTNAAQKRVHMRVALLAEQHTSCQLTDD